METEQTPIDDMGIFPFSSKTKVVVLCFPEFILHKQVEASSKSQRYVNDAGSII